jgi:DNA processing protein
VFAVPGRTDDPYSEGCNHLIRNHKASLIQSESDIRYIMMWDDENSKTASHDIQQKLFVELSSEEQILADLLTAHRKLDVDSISCSLGQPQSRVAALLLSLEFKGILKALPGKMYQLV